VLMPTVQVMLPAIAVYDALIDGELLEPA
jgi:hypothetical protein